MCTQFQPPSAVIVGADGFIGRRLTLALSAQRIRVDCYTRQRRFFRGAELAQPLRAADVVYYLASSINPAISEQHPELAAADHRQFARLMHELAGLGSPPTVVLASSGGTVYDPVSPPPYTEESRTRATSLYAASKLALEDELGNVAGAVPGVILRLSNVYGPGQRTGKGQGVLAYWLLAAARRGALRLIGDPENTHDYVYIDDVVGCLCLLLEASRPRPAAVRREPLVLNVGSGRGTSLAELIEIVKTVVGRDLPVERQPAPQISRPHVWLDYGRAERLLGWCPRTLLTDGVSAMWHELGVEPPALSSSTSEPGSGRRPESRPRPERQASSTAA